MAKKLENKSSYFLYVFAVVSEMFEFNENDEMAGELHTACTVLDTGKGVETRLN